MLSATRQGIAWEAVGHAMAAYEAALAYAGERTSFGKPIAGYQLVQGLFGWQDYACARPGPTSALAPLPEGVPVQTAMSALGPTGITAYFGLLDVGRPKVGETVVISGAAGATGSAAGQIAKIQGCRVIGIAGGAEKCRALVEEYGFDGAVDYKTDKVGKRLRELCPNGIDIFFDNVGGEILDAALANLAWGARVVICGAISQYNATESPRGPANYMQLLVMRAQMTGFVIFDYAKRYPEGAAQLAQWLREGKLVSREDVVEGDIADFPAVLLRLFRGQNTGKLVLAL